MIITLENDQDKLQISEELEQLLTAGLNVVARLHSLSERTEVDITIVDDEEIHMLNRDYRNVDRPTDVLSFALDEESEEEPELLGGPEEHLLGDIIISAETASRQAEEFGTAGRSCCTKRISCMLAVLIMSGAVVVNFAETGRN